MDLLGNMFFSDKCELMCDSFPPILCFYSNHDLKMRLWTLKTNHSMTDLKRETDDHGYVSYLIPSNLSVPIQVITIWCSVRKQPLSLGEQTVFVLYEFLYVWIFCSFQFDIYVFILYSSVLMIHYFWNWRLIKSWIHLNLQLTGCHAIST